MPGAPFARLLFYNKKTGWMVGSSVDVSEQLGGLTEVGRTAYIYPRAVDRKL